MRVFVIAGEPSGDKLGAALMAGLKTLSPNVEFAGIGGEGMQAAGLESQFDMSELSLMGIAEVLPKYFHLKRRIRETAEAIIAFSPDVLVTIDSPDFCLRVARLVKARSDVFVVHYVAPQVWAWRPGRAQKMARSVDHVLALLPFEPPYMHAAGMGCDFVGHPVVSDPQASEADIAAFRALYELGQGKLILALPGSRTSEIERLSPVFGEALQQVLAKHPGARIIVPLAQGVGERVQGLVANWPGDPILIPATDTSAKRAAFHLADVALAASGTVSLELAAARTPMVIAYNLSWLSMKIMQRLARVSSVSLVNLVTDSRVVPEFIGPDCRADLIAPALLALLDDPGPQAQAMAQSMDLLGADGDPPGLRAARAVLVAIE